MKLKEIFEKDINRHIEGVIKVDDEKNIVEEVEEYVITNEVDQRLKSFFDVYSSSINTKISDIGVWLSGFFGSGKSHLLKIISYILENRKYDHTTVGEVFLKKISDFELEANIRKALQLPTKIILFNIDQKAEVDIGNQNTDSLLPVFVKVFNELQGFSKDRAIAEFEYSLEKQEIFSKFKEKYAQISGTEWEEGRDIFDFEIDNIAETLSYIKGMNIQDSKKLLDIYYNKTSIDIEDFALRIKKYIDKQGNNFRLVFCVDEMGQFIADNSKLMLNLQTIAETLATKCGNQAWILVTSQEDMDATIGDMSQKQSNDFSKIQGRFVTRINLSSANADEVIQKRLLTKKADSTKELLSLYEKEKNNFRSLVYFDSNTRQYRDFKDDEHFVFTYPFIPYQFELFQASIRGLSKHNAFQGRHQSVGERSMLSVFQLVSRAIAEKEIGSIVTYDLFFDGLQAAIRSESRSSIITAEKNLDNKFAIKVLKILFMIKYIREFKANKHNISRLLVDNFNINIKELETKVQEALNILEEQTYVQQTGGLYEFLTDEEKEIENEIKSVEIELPAVKKRLTDYIFDEIIRDNKIRFNENKQDYKFTRKIDDEKMQGRDEDLAINFITPLYDGELSESYLKMKSLDKKNSEMIVQMADDVNLKKELELVLKTEKFVKQSQSESQKESIKLILANKREQNQQRISKLISNIEDLIVNSKIYLAGNMLDINTSSAREKILGASQDLISSVYYNLKMLGSNPYKEVDISNIILSPGNDIYYSPENPLSDPEREVFYTYLNNKYKNHERVTVKSVIDYFSIKPYGWYQSGILCMVAKLYKRKKIDLKKDGNDLTEHQLIDALKNSNHYPNTIIEPIKTVEVARIRELKDFQRDFLDLPNSEIEAKEVHKIFTELLKKEIENLLSLYSRKEKYKFLDKLSEPLEKAKEIVKMNYIDLFENIGKYSEHLLDLKDELIDPIKNLMNNNERKSIYDDILIFLQDEGANLGYIDSAKNNIENLIKLKDNKEPYKSQVIKNAKTDLDIVKPLIKEQLVKEREQAIDKLNQIISKFQAFDEFISLKDNQKQEVLKPFIDLKSKIPNEKLISELRYRSQEISSPETFDKQLKKLSYFIEENKPKVSSGQKEEYTIITKKIISINSIRPEIGKNTLDTKEDVLIYIDKLKETMLSEIENNKKISL